MAENGNDSGSGMKDVIEKLATLEDLQNLVQLDVINLKNEIERLKLVSTSPVSEEIGERIVQLEQMSKDVELFKRWKQTVDEVKFLRERLMALPSEQPPDRPPKPAESIAESKGIEELRNEIERVRKELKAKKTVAPSIDIGDLKAAIEENRNAVENLKIMITEKPKGAVPDIDYIRNMTKENRRLLDDLRMKIEMSSSTVPPETHENLRSLHDEVTKLEEEIGRIKEQRPSGSKAPPRGEIDSLKRELYTKLDDLNLKYGPKSSEEIKKAIEANRASIEKLKSLISGEEVTIESLKKELGESRKFMAEVRSLILSKGTGMKKLQIQLTLKSGRGCSSWTRK